MNSFHRVLCDAKHALWHVLSECSHGGKNMAGSHYIILLVLLLLLGASSSPWRSVLFGHETGIHHNRSSLKALSNMSNAMELVKQYGALSDSTLLKMEWQNNKPVFQINHTTRITGIRG